MGGGKRVHVGKAAANSVDAVASRLCVGRHYALSEGLPQLTLHVVAVGGEEHLGVGMGINFLFYLVYEEARGTALYGDDMVGAADVYAHDVG